MEMTKTNCNKFFARFLLLVTVGTGTAGYSDETVFTNNNSITNKLLSVEKFVFAKKKGGDLSQETRTSRTIAIRVS